MIMMKPESNAATNIKSPSGPYWVYGISSLPLFGLIACVVISLYKDYRDSTATHCHVTNILPSISAAIGEFKPQKQVWQFCIALHAGPRLLSPLVIQTHFSRYTLISPLFQPMVLISSLLHLVEIIALVMLSFVSSIDNYGVHKFSFITFILASIISMICQLILRRWIWEWKTLPWPFSYYFRQQLLLFITYLSCLGCACFFFLRHNTYCEPYVYSLFAFSEYVTVVINIVINCHFALDFVGDRDEIFRKVRPI